MIADAPHSPIQPNIWIRYMPRARNSLQRGTISIVLVVIMFLMHSSMKLSAVGKRPFKTHGLKHLDTASSLCLVPCHILPNHCVFPPDGASLPPRSWGMACPVPKFPEVV